MGDNWYDDPEILALFKRQREIADFPYGLEVYERRFYSHNVTSIEVEMKLGETKLWSLAGAF